MPLLVRFPSTPSAERAGGEKALALQQLLFGRGGVRRRGLAPFFELFAHEDRKVTDRSRDGGSAYRMAVRAPLTRAAWRAYASGAARAGSRRRGRLASARRHLQRWGRERQHPAPKRT